MKICMMEQIPEDTAHGFTLPDGQKIFITNHDGHFFAYQNLCPHLKIELEFLENDFLNSDHSYIQCNTHGALFEITNGYCISGPCLGKSLTKINIQVHSDGGIYLI